jgi:hypothetical protein
MYMRILGALRTPTFWVLVAIFGLEFYLFDQFGARRHTPVYPRWHDQIQYLSESYTGYEFARSRGVVAGLLNALTTPSAQGTLHDFLAIIVFLLAGPSRSAALSVNLLAMIGWQVALFFAVARTSGSRPLALATMMLPLALTGPWQNIPGSAYDFRLDHLAMCALGVTAALAILTDGFRSRRASAWFGVAVGLTVLTRFLTGTYFVLIFAGLAGWILLGAERKPRLLNLLRAGLVATAISGPFLWLNYEVVREYYWIGHYVGAESAIRNQSFGLGRSIGFVSEQLGQRHLGVFFGALAAAGGVVLSLIRLRPPKSVANAAWMIGAIFLFSPAVVLTLHPQKSEVVVSALVPGLVVLVFAAWSRAARRTSPKAEMIYAAAVMLVTFTFFTRAQVLPAYSPENQADIRQVNAIADRIFVRGRGVRAQPPRIAVDYVTDGFDAHAFRVIVYERKRIWVPYDIRLPTGIAEPSDALVMERLAESDFVFLSEEAPAGVYPFDQKLATLRPQLRAWCEANLRPAERFSLFGRRMVLYQRREIPFP